MNSAIDDLIVTPKTKIVVYQPNETTRLGVAVHEVWSGLEGMAE